MITTQPAIAALPLLRTDLFINGEWREAADGQRMPVHDPATEDAFADVAAGSVDDALAAVDAAQRAARPWARVSPRDRAEILRRGFELMIARREELATLIVRENGKALADARGEATYAAEFLRWYAEEAVRADGWLGTSPNGAHRVLVLREPIGVSVLVTPWNFPAAMATRKIAPALAAGCTVVLKPASETPLAALWFADICQQAGVPAGVVNVVPTRRSGDAVRAMLHHPAVRKLSFTGSTEVGRVLLAEAADQVLSCSMELGGNAPFIVLADADLDAAIEGAMIAKMRNGGEACTAANRFYVHAAVAQEFTDRLARAMAGLRVGPGMDPDNQVGPLINAAGRDKVTELVAATLDAGARIVTGGTRPERRGFFYAPTVLEHVPFDAPVMAQEVFGPVAPIATFDDEDEMLARANGVVHGLVAYLYTRDLGRGLALSERLEFGMVGLNRGLVSEPAAPFGGVKQSGLGREGAHDGLLEFLETKYIATSW